MKPLDKVKDYGYSLAHGAGRRMSRSSALKAKKLKDKRFIDNKFDSILLCDNKDLVYEEAPRTYKQIDDVIKDLVEFGLIKVVARLEPVMTYKTLN